LQRLVGIVCRAGIVAMGDATSLLSDTASTRAESNVEVAQVVGERDMERYALCCSGGKDSVLALDRAIRAGLQVDRLMTLYDERSARVRFHGVPIAVMRAQPKADPLWLGQPLSEDLISACEQRGLDPCGEYGEYHTLVTNGPLFSHPLAVRWGPIHVEDEATTLQRFQQLDVQVDAPP
jgi:diphthamide synthase (EF-2-diphthine--ammonia ligase)